MTPTRHEPRSALGRVVRSSGFTLLETLLALAIATLLLGGLAGVTGQSLQAWTLVREREALTQGAQFAMERMVGAVRGTSRLMLPLAENPATAWSESVRDVLAVALDPGLDRDQDGFADADNDRDGRVDEDMPGDSNADGAPGILGIDDDGDGAIDEGGDQNDNDEDGTPADDASNGIDDDGDGAVDEDMPSDMNKDLAPGIAGVDDDGDGTIDEGLNHDDDEDGAESEDWCDAVVYFLSGTTLVERLPNLDPSDGLDFTERVIAENVSLFQAERLAPSGSDRAVLVEITLQLSSQSGESVDLRTRVRAGGAP
jgi:type II secretory pathway pseudopilin PulG